ncbi:hypothetical protein FRC07_006742 [Ceratobasidium sp. 392]|nr:hypothetical protein FRC07_006742 [Ceratobasidium sp. 392]
MGRLFSFSVSVSAFLKDSFFSMTEYTHIINGKPATSAQKLDVINPGTQRKVAEVPIATKEQLDETVAAARAALPAWSATPVDERAEILNKIADVIEKNMEEYKQIIMQEQGRPPIFAQFEPDASIMWLRGVSKLRLPTTVLVENEHQKTTERYVPIGLCASIVPWNGPMMLCALKLASTMITGNTAIIKPSPFAPLTVLRFISDIQHLVPPGVVSALSGDDGLGPMITAHPGIDKISFTGSTFTGQKVMESASVGLRRVTLELGGNDPVILLPDVDVKALVPEIFWGAFRNSGQGCILAKRIYIHEKIYDEFRDALVEFAKTIKVGLGPDAQLGPIQNIPQYKRVVSHFEDVHANSYKFVLGGDIDPNPTNGLFAPISIVDNPPDDSKIVREEPFGPIVPLLKWDDEKDVVKRANDTNMGLAASVWGKDLEVVERIALQLQAGTVSMNQFIPFGVETSFGGHKQSGLGVEGGVAGLKAYTNVQIVTINKNPVLMNGA